MDDKVIEIILSKLDKLEEKLDSWHRDNEHCHISLKDEVNQLKISNAEGKAKLGILFTAIGLICGSAINFIMKKVGIY